MVAVPPETGGWPYMNAQFAAGLISTDPEAFLRPGDSGGPILCRTEKGIAKLVGVHSYIAPYDNTVNSVLVGTPENLRWIDAQTRNR